MTVRPPLGESDFIRLRQDGLTYVDKTREVAALLDDPARVLLLTRPRRFGKTLLLATLQAFVERQDLAGVDTTPLFSGTAIEADARAARHRQRYAVVSLSLRELKPTTFSGLVSQLAEEIRHLLNRHRWLLDEGGLPPIARTAWEELVGPSPSTTRLQAALRDLTGWLHEATGQGVFVLLDEYDTPLQTAWLRGYYDEAIELLRPFLSKALKDNPSLAKAVVTGITRVAQESLFSGLNNIVVSTVLDADHATACGFTEPEVDALLESAGLAPRQEEVQAWYDGYRIGGRRLYNPWSVLSFIRSPERGFETWWANTAGDDLLRALLVTGARAIQPDLEAILRGETIERPVIDHLILRDLPGHTDAIWTLLLHAGYLQAVEQRVVHGERWATLAPPNLELRVTWRLLFKRWMAGASEGSGAVEELTRALLRGDQPIFQDALQRFAMRNLSALDPTGGAPERVWHAFVLGLLAHMADTHRVQSEPEAGLGRADVLVTPLRGGPGVVLEFKKVGRGETHETALDAAMAQIDDRRYADRLVEAGASPVWRVAVAFSGREVAVRVGARRS